MKSPMVLPEKLGQFTKCPEWRETARLYEGYKVIAYKEGYSNPWNEIIDCRIYARGNGRSMGSNCCLIWVLGGTDNAYGRGYGVAGGCGYHRTSAALSSALHSMGIQLGGFECSGVGDDAMRQALLELARLLGFDNVHLVHFHR